MLKYISTAVAVLCAMLGGCAVGPDYVRPALPETKAYSPEPIPAQSVQADNPTATVQKFNIEADIRGDWWTLFQSNELNALIENHF